jgi:hypothetical protein
MLRLTGVEPERALALRRLMDLGCAVALERPLQEAGEICVIEGRGHKIVGRGATADAAAADALARWKDADG